MRSLVVVGLALIAGGCERGRTPAAVGQVAAGAPAVPAELLDAPPWIYRELSTGVILHQSMLHTYTLRRHGNRALLTVDVQTAPSSTDPAAIGPWSPKSTKRYVGTVEVRGGAILMKLSHGGEILELPCAMGTLAAAAASAVRRPHPRGRDSDACDGDRGRWVPGATTRIEVLRCGLFNEDDPDADRDERMAFMAAPGIEYLFVNDDCDQQGGGYRLIAKDGSIAKVR